MVPRPPQSSTIEIEIEEDADVVVEDEYEAASSAAPFALHQSRPPAPMIDAVSTAGPDLMTRLRQILQQIEVYRRAKDYDHAIAYLFEAVNELPASRELREKLCDVLIEAGDQDEAVRQMLAFARWLADIGDVDGATRILDEVLLLEPSQGDAIQMLRDLGYTVHGDEPGAEYGQPGAGAAYDPSAPLPSYDLEEVGAGEALSRGARAGRAFAASQLDDPFAEAPLPSFDLDDEAARYQNRDSSEISRTGGGVVVPPPAPSPPAGQLDEDALEEVEFFAANNMFDDARNVLEAELSRLPNHPLLLERLRELEEHAAAAEGGGSGTRAVPRSSVPASAGPGSGYGGIEDRSFDIAASLDALDALDAGPQQEAPAPDSDQVSVEAVFEQFKAGVAAQISESDAATHYDLGAAYKEMGLLSDAIAEFELASRDPGRECVCQWMIGMIHREQGNIDAAISAFIRGLHAQAKTPDQEMALTYEIGDSYEERRAADQALYYFQRVLRMSPGYADPRGSVADRVRRLEPGSASKTTAKAVGAESVDEFDAVLDDLMGGGKLP